MSIILLRSAGSALNSALTTEQDWTNRSTAPGVVKAMDFRTLASVTDFIHGWTKAAGAADHENAAWETGNKLSGNGSLRINSPASVGQNAAAWRAPLNDSWTTDGQGFSGAQYYITFQVYHAANRLTCGSDGDGFKILNLAEYRFSDPDNSRSHPDGEIVLTTKASSAYIPICYRDVGGGTTPGFEVAFGGGGNQLYQPEVDNGIALPNDQRYCLWTGGSDTFAGCVKWPIAEWFEVRLEIKIASTGGTGNSLRYAIKRFGQLEQLMFNPSGFNIAIDSLTPNGINGIWFQNFDTNRTTAVEDTYTLYTQLIVSTQPIAARAA